MEKSEHSVYVFKNKMSLGLLNDTANWPWNKALYAMFLGCLGFCAAQNGVQVEQPIRRQHFLFGINTIYLS